MKPAIGRIVHYGREGGVVEPAIITAVHSDDCVNLRIFNDDTAPTAHVTSVVQSPPSDEGADPKPVEVGCWGWPPRI